MPLPELTAENALIFRITHKDNLPWILSNGLHCRNSSSRDSNFVNIGMTDLIDKRIPWVVPRKPGGALSDYVPFYFTPRSMMAFNIHTGRGVRQRDNVEIIILVTSLVRLCEQGVPFLITDKHACANNTYYSDDLPIWVGLIGRYSKTATSVETTKIPTRPTGIKLRRWCISTCL